MWGENCVKTGSWGEEEEEEKEVENMNWRTAEEGKDRRDGGKQMRRKRDRGK